MLVGQASRVVVSVVEPNVFKVADVVEHTAVVGWERAERRRFGGFRGRHAGRRAGSGQDGVVELALVNHHLGMAQGKRPLLSRVVR